MTEAEAALQKLREIDLVRLKQAMADVERVRMGGYTVELVWGDKIVVKKDPEMKQERGIWRRYCDMTSSGHWDETDVVAILKREQEEIKNHKPYRYRPPVIRLNDRMDMEAKRAANAWDKISTGKKTIRKNEKGSLVGAYGEQALRYHLGLTMRMDVVEDGGDHGYDMVFKNYKIDVKASDSKSCNYMIANDYWEPGKCDAMVCAHVVGRTVKLIGWTWEQDFADKADKGSDYNLGFTPNCKVLPVGRLQSMQDFLKTQPPEPVDEAPEPVDLPQQEALL